MRSDTLRKLTFPVAFLFLFLPGLALFLFSGFILEPEQYSQLSLVLKEILWLIILVLLAGTALLSFALNYFIKTIFVPIEHLSDYAAIRFDSDDSEPAQISGAFKPIQKLVHQINAAADVLHNQKKTLDKELKSASKRLADERDTLAAIIEQLNQGVIVTNSEGTVLLFNSTAGTLLSNPDADPPVYLGLGRHLSALFGSNMISFALEESRKRSASEPFHFTAPAPDLSIVKIRVLPVTNAQNQETGFVFLAENVTSALKAGKQLNEMMDESIRKLRDSIAAVRMSTENLMDYPEMQESQRNQFLQIIDQESQKVADLSETFQLRGNDDQKVAKELPVMHAISLIDLVHNLCMRADIPASIGEYPNGMMLFADAYSLPVGLAFLTRFIHNNTESEIRFDISTQNQFACLNIRWISGILNVDEAQALELESPEIAGLRVPYALRDIFRRHEAEWWIEQEDSGGVIKIIIPATTTSEPEKPHVPNQVRSYDFDLFRITPDSSVLNLPLETITATVFDTETTGLYPSDGDRLVSVGAVRLVNGKLQDQSFHQLIHPQRRIPKRTQEIHGITDEMVSDKPAADIVLRNFHLFCSSDPLIAHNAAFDMRFLELEQKKAGVQFDQPVLDTLLLSNILHVHLDGHSIDALVSRYGIPQENRHEALGDAIVTAKIFLKMIPLLRQIGIVTVGDALKATKESLYAKLRY